MASNLPNPTVDLQIMTEEILRLNAKMNLVYPGGTLDSPLTESIAVTGAAPSVSPTMKPPLPSHAPELEYVDRPLRLLLLTLTLFPKT